MSQPTALDLRWLDSAVRLARPFLGTTGAAPTVGALIVDPHRQIVFGRAVTGRGGRPHAAIQALSEARGSARGRTVYITMEPCTGQRNSGCADALVHAGVTRVVIGTVDPDPAHAGGGCARLQRAGVEAVLTGHPASRDLHEFYSMRVGAGRPFVSATLAVSRDGMIARRDGGRVAIAGAAARRWLELERATSDAVMIGGRTAALDDPSLAVSLEGLEQRSRLRIIVVGRGPLEPRLNLIQAVSASPTVLIAEDGYEATTPPFVEVLRVAGRNGRPRLAEGLQALARKGINRLLVEGGAGLTEAMLAADLVDRFFLVASQAEVGSRGLPATLLGGIEGRLRGAGFAEVDRQRLGDDQLCIYERDI